MDEYTKKLLEENLELTKKIQTQTTYIKRYVITAQVFSVLKVLLIVVPIVIGIIYIPPLLKEFQPMLKNTLGLYQTALGLSNPTELDSESDEEAFKRLPLEEQLKIKKSICQ